MGSRPQAQEQLCHRAMEPLGFAQQDTLVHVLCHQNLSVLILTTTKKPQTSPKPTILLHYLLFIFAQNIWFHFLGLLVSRVNDI